ncbi:hypothetical protein C8R43DRAFT_1114319 [Mycena crocata]|nr:hypothetical protein C8R43DRAFT_1114319 [Mycena crocata]
MNTVNLEKSAQLRTFPKASNFSSQTTADENVPEVREIEITEAHPENDPESHGFNVSDSASEDGYEYDTVFGVLYSYLDSTSREFGPSLALLGSKAAWSSLQFSPSPPPQRDHRSYTLPSIMLPDEIISEILSPALKVSDELFSDASDVSPFASFAPSTSAYLLVCKDWLRVATPLLYNVVVLRSKAQAAALQKVLRKNESFGRFIKKLRVEGGYGMAMHTILASAPNITDLHLSLSIWSSDSTEGLCKGLPLVNPHRVIVVDPILNLRKVVTNQHQTALSKALFRCIAEWDNLEIFGFPYPSTVEYFRWAERAKNLMQALAESKTLHTLLLSQVFGIPQFFRPLLKIPALRVVHFQPPYDKIHHQRIIEGINSDPQLKVLVRYDMPEDSNDTGFQALDIAPSLNPAFVPMASASADVREFVWKRVFWFLLAKQLNPSRHTSSTVSRVAVLLVSKCFNRLALPALYTDLQIRYYKSDAIVKQVQARPELGSSISSLDMPDLGETVNRSIISSANRLKKLVAKRLSAELFELLGITAGSTLQELSATLQNVNISASVFVFAHFTELRVCELWGFTTRFTPTAAPDGVLARLHTLRFNSCHESIFDAFSAMRQVSMVHSTLPALHTVHIDVVYTAAIKFLQAHGASILHAQLQSARLLPYSDSVFDVCRNLVDVHFHEDLALAHLTCKTPLESLAKITAYSILGDPDAVDPTMFPSLREIQCRAFKWPTTEREISKSKWVPIAETLLEKNIKLADSSGRHWVPRTPNLVPAVDHPPGPDHGILLSRKHNPIMLKKQCTRGRVHIHVVSMGRKFKKVEVYEAAVPGQANTK